MDPNLRSLGRSIFGVLAGVLLASRAAGQTPPSASAPQASAVAPAATSVQPTPAGAEAGSLARSAPTDPPAATPVAAPGTAPAVPAGTAPAYPPATAPPYAAAPYPPASGGQPAEFRYDPARGVPAGYEVETRPRKGLVISGAIVFGVAYGLSVFGAALSGEGQDAAATNWLYLPVLGPFIGATQVDRERQCYDEYVATTRYPCNEGLTETLVIDGFVQLVGATLFTLGFALPKKWLVPSPYAALQVAPTRLGTSAYGLGVGGRF